MPIWLLILSPRLCADPGNALSEPGRPAKTTDGDSHSLGGFGFCLFAIDPPGKGTS
jgi:hypothetical protein